MRLSHMHSDFATLTCSHVLSGAQVTWMTLDENGELQCLCGAEGHTVPEGRIIGLQELRDLDPTLPDLDLAPGQSAALNENGQWQIEPLATTGGMT